MLYRNGNEFASGRARFLDRAPGFNEVTGKIFIRVVPQPLGVELIAQLDTGSPWLVFDPEVFRALGLLDGNGPRETLGTRFGPKQGRLERINITIVADVGHALDVEATAFVCEEWPRGFNFVGYSGVLERVRFALDPEANDFYFGMI